MTIVEHTLESKYPTFVWAKDIKVSVAGQEIEVSGIIPILEEERFAARDPLRGYREAISRYAGAKRQGKNSPHVQFANADNVQKQVTFLKQYGPVVVSSSHTEERAISSQDPFDFRLSETVIVARQNVSELKREHLVYRSALVLISELHRGKESDISTVRECLSTIVSNVSEWPSQWERERRLRVNGLGYVHEPQWNFTKENLRHLEIRRWNAMQERSGDPIKDAFMALNPVHDGHLVTCELINAFTPVVYPWGDSPVEAPHWDIASGIRPLLYYILRREYLGATGIGICRNSDCRAIFEIERSGQEFCGEECSRLQRQRQYWSIRGKKLRKRRLARRAIGTGGAGHKKRKER
jgi:hypothetical protein